MPSYFNVRLGIPENTLHTARVAGRLSDKAPAAYSRPDGAEAGPGRPSEGYYTADELMASLDVPEVYRVGGSVRDELLGRPTKDHDYMVRGASIEQITGQLSGKVGSVRPLKLRDGRQVGVRFAYPGGLCEVVLPRKEVSTGPGHRQFRIVCDPRVTVEQDAHRRDFTINALYRDVRSGKLVDPLDGGKDIMQERVRTTHPDSFRDDPLRILRALRFVSQLDFLLAPETYGEMCEHAKHVDALTLKGVSGTVLDELCKLLMGVKARSGFGTDA
jgi:tRNA nucleotidyltransferase/poly(A) polymerase